MKWTKLTEKLPDPNTPVYLKGYARADKGFIRQNESRIFIWEGTQLLTEISKDHPEYYNHIEWLNETESPSDSETVDTESPVQYGTAFEADCEDGTWTFKMDEPFYVMAGRFKIIPLKK